MGRSTPYWRRSACTASSVICTPVKSSILVTSASTKSPGGSCMIANAATETMASSTIM